MTAFRKAEFDGTFEGWRSKARLLLAEGVTPGQEIWQGSQAETPLFEAFIDTSESQVGARAPVRVPKAFLSLARTVSQHRNPARWEWMYRTLWRLVHENAELLKITVDCDVARLLEMEAAIRRDLHKMKAFVRFKKISGHYLAWYDPDHFILRAACPFFQARFQEMDWSILTPDESVTWINKVLSFGPGVSQRSVTAEDDLEEVWQSYYASIFNPARLKLRAMKKELPVRRWKALPEAKVIRELIQSAPERVEKMVKDRNHSAADFFPDPVESLHQVREAALHCKGCELYRGATGTVFGVGPSTAKMALVGEQPGDEEDRRGEPFVGPAGKVLDKALNQAGLSRKDLYVTNAVKHFKFKMTYGRRLHQKPVSREIVACRPWLEKEMDFIRPKVLVLLGATAAQSVMGKVVRLADVRSRFFPTPWCENTLVTNHPSAILRMPDAKMKEEAFANLVRDLNLAASESSQN